MRTSGFGPSSCRASSSACNPAQFTTHRASVGHLDDALDGEPEAQLDAPVGDQASELARHHSEVHDARARDVQRGDTTGVRLQLGELDRVDHARGDPVLVGALREGEEPGPLALVGRDDDLAAHVEGDLVLTAQAHELRGTARAHAGLGRPGPVVHTRVDDAGVAPALVEADGVLFLDHRDAEARRVLDERPRGREADDAGTDDDDVVARL